MDRTRMINMVTGTEMSVPADLVEKYLAAGHKLADAPAATASPKPATKAPRKKATTKK